HGAGKRKQLRYIEPVLVIPLIWFYALITGFSPSVCRAVLMLTFYVAGKSLNRSHNSYNLVAISAFFLLIYNPYYLFDVGFQLSYLAVTGLICLHPKIYHLLYLKNKLTDKIWSYTALSIAAQLATFPLSIYYFHQFPVYFLLSNLFIALPVSAIMYAGFAFLLVPVDAIADVSGSVLSYMITSVNAILSYIENIPFSTIDDLWVSVLEFVLLYVMIGTFIAAFQLRSKKILMAGICCVLILITSFTRRSIQNKSRHELIFYSLHKNMAIGYLKNGRGSIITDLVKGDKALTYSIYPVMSGGGVRRQTLYHDSVRISGISNRHFYKFGDFKILKWNGTADLTAFNYPIEVDAVLLTSDPRINIRELKERIRFSILLIDGTNPDYRVSRWQADARQLGVKYYILKNNPALIVDLSG
ncbi:MAG TPA: ComEC/Rec2 family competence protein, partial [Sphingobacteriaceae bacterium]